jgi:acetate kinase
MSGAILALNCGSSSVKFALYDEMLAQTLQGRVENIGAGLVPQLWVENRPLPIDPAHNSHAAILADILDKIVVPHSGKPAAVGHRVVHGGTRFAGPARIDLGIRAEISALAPLAPSHQPHNLAGIDAVARLWPETPQIAVFDTAFHRTVPEHRQLMPLPRRFAEEGLRRFGFHGISYQSIVSRLPGLIGERANGRIVVCHLGNGCSLAAIVDGQCRHTSMGFTPLDGLMMGRRPGRLDPGAVLWLVTRHGGDVAAVDRLLNQESGLLGVSGISSDMRTLLEDDGNDAELAIAMFVDRLVQEIAAAAAAIGGIDALIFTGGIGENAAPIRASAVQSLAWLGFALTEPANALHATTITIPGRQPSAHVVATAEELVIAQAARSFAQPE